MAAPPESLYSQACNFASFLQKGVDPRTGQYTCTIQLYEAPAQTRNCPSFKLALSFSPMSSGLTEFGRGWSLNIPYFDPQSGTVSTSTGEVYRLADNRHSLRDSKLESFKFQWDLTTRQGSLLYKSGQVEVVSDKKNDRTFKRAELQSLHSPSGRALDFVWQSTNADRRLQKIMDGTKCLVQFEYEELRTRIVTAPDTSESRTYSLSIRNNRLDKLELPDTNLSWNFQYNTYGPLWCIDAIDSPSGLKEEIKYRVQDGAHLLPSGPKQPYPSIPNVSQHTAWPYQGQPAIVTNYQYSDTNFLGYGSGIHWTDEGDNLYLLVEPYNYTTTVTIGDVDRPKMTTVYTYNKYHLETSSVHKQGKKSVSRVIDYYAAPIGKFDDQVPYYLLPKKVHATYKDETADPPKQRSETTEYEYDSAGNPTKEVQPSGQKIERKYYAADGEDGCPADPLLFIRYMKEQTVTPASSRYETPTRRRTYTYRSLSPKNDELCHNPVLVEEECSFEGASKELTRTKYDYVCDAASPHHGRLSEQIDTLFGANSITHTWGYDVDPSANEFTRKVVSKAFDGRSIEHSSIFSSLTGLEKSHRNRAQVENKFEYDSLGRLSAVTAAVGSDYVTTRSQSYSRVPNTVGYCLTVTDVSGIQTKYYTDGLERIVRSEKQESLNSETFRVVQERKYDECGLCVEAVELDWFYGDDNKPPTEQRSVMQLGYDDWGQVCLRSTSDGKGRKGKAITTSMDPISLIKMEGDVGEGQTKTLLNDAGLVAQKTLLTKEEKVESSISYDYDGFARQVSETDHLGRETKYEMDSFDRVTKTTWPGNRVVHTEFSSQSASILPTSIKLGKHELGKQDYDGLDRVKTTTVGSRTLTNTFQNDQNIEPNKLTLPSGKQSTLEYVPELNYAVKKINESDTIDFDPKTGTPVLLVNGHLKQVVKYYDTGLVSREEWELQDGGTSWFAEYNYSLGGKLQSYTDVHGQKQVIGYDTLSQPEKLTQGPMQVEYVYSEAQRLSRIDTTSTSGNSKIATELAYDDFGRVDERKVSKGSSVLRKMKQIYNSRGLVSQRSLQTESGVSLREETFEYDVHNRLEDYTCVGIEAPVDEYGNNIKSQNFEFDDFDNLKTVTTLFEDGTENIATYCFADHDPTQLTDVKNTHSGYPPRVELKYNENGSLTRDEKGQSLSYDELNRLSAVRDSDDEPLCEYRYDALGRLVCQKVPNQPDTHFFYRGTSLVAVEKGERKTSLVVSDPYSYWGQIVKEGNTSTTQHWLSDGNGSVLGWIEAGEVHYTHYTPYGFSPRDSSSSIGFNGQWRDPITGWYHLGNGYRVYNPILMRFHTPDPSSPFTSGEINPYAYCLGDPINRIDPSGHFSLFGLELSWKDILMTVASIAVGAVAAALTGGASIAIQIGVSVAVSVTTDFATSVSYDLAAGNAIDWGDLGVDLVLSAITGAVPGLGDAAKAAVRGPTKAVAKASVKGAVKKSIGQKVKGAVKNKVKELPKKAFDSAVSWGIETTLETPLKDLVGVGGDTGPSQSLDQESKEADDSTLARSSGFAARDSIRPVLKETQSSLGAYGVHPSSGASFSGQSLAHLLNRELRTLYGQQDGGPTHGLGAQHSIRGLQDAIRATVRRPHDVADWISVSGIGGS